MPELRVRILTNYPYESGMYALVHVPVYNNGGYKSASSLYAPFDISRARVRGDVWESHSFAHAKFEASGKFRVELTLHRRDGSVVFKQIREMQFRGNREILFKYSHRP